MENKIYKVASGEISLWLDDGVICMKTINPYNDPVELNEHEAEELAHLLLQLVDKTRTGQ
jgi:hypothetical protein